MIGARLKLPLLLLVALVLHQSLFAGIRIAEVRPDLMLLVAVACGVAGGPERGAVIGFAAGLLTDLLVQTPLGLSALTFSLVGFAVGTVQSTIIRSAWWIPAITAFWASVAGVLLYALLGAIVGQDQFLQPDLVVTAAIVGAVNSVLAPLLVTAANWALTAGPERA